MIGIVGGGAALMHRLMAEEKVSVSPFASVDEARESHVTILIGSICHIRAKKPIADIT